MGKTKPVYIAAFSIEDRVVFKLREDATLARPMNLVSSNFSRPIDKGAKNYFAEVRRLLDLALTELYDEVVGKYDRKTAVDVFARIDLLCVSCPGVIRDNSTLIQLPLWHWKTDGAVEWTFQRKRRQEFDFPLEIYEILLSIGERRGHDVFVRFIRIRQSWIVGRTAEKTGRSGRRLADRDRNVIVVNDAAACAAAEHSARSRDLGAKRAGYGSVTYVRAHDGINIGTINEGFEGGRPHHAELGHIYPRRHEIDVGLETTCACSFHSRCLEGFVAAATLVERAKNAPVDHPSIGHWRRFYDANAGRTDLEDLLCKFLLGDRLNGGDRDGVDLVAWYVAQLVFNLVLSPSPPMAVVIGGKLATPPVLAAVRSHVLSFHGDYPRRDEITKGRIGGYVTGSRFGHDTPDDEGPTITGALAIAQNWTTRRRPGRRYHEGPELATSDGLRVTR